MPSSPVIKKLVACVVSVAVLAGTAQPGWSQVRLAEPAAGSPVDLAPLQAAPPAMQAALAASPALTLSAVAELRPLSQLAPLPAGASGTRAGGTPARAAGRSLGRPAEGKPLIRGVGRLLDAVGPAEGPGLNAKPLDAAFDNKKGGPKTATTIEDAAADIVKHRQAVRKDATTIVRQELGGDVGDGVLHKDLGRVLKRLTDALGLPPETARVYYGNSLLPNAFTTITPSDAKLLDKNGGSGQVFVIANIFVSLGLLRAVKNEHELAWILAHELMHNFKGHLKTNQAAHAMLGHFHELEADVAGLRLTALAGYDPRLALGALDSLEQEYDRLEKDYALLKRDKGDLIQSLQRVRDIHPHHEIRRATLVENMDEALERYKPQPVAALPLWKTRSVAPPRPTHMERFGARLEAAIAESSVESSLRLLEAFIRKEQAKRTLAIEEEAAVEKAYTRLSERAATVEEVRYLQVSMRRQEGMSRFPTRALEASLLTRMAELTVDKLPGRGDLTAFAGVAMGLAEQAKRGGTLRMLARVRSRRELEAAFTSLNREAENLGLDLARFPKEKGDPVRDRLILTVSSKLWGAARRVLTAELGRPAMPEEIIAELQAKLSPPWLKKYSLGLNVEVLESAFGPEASRSRTYRPSQLAALLEGRAPEDFLKDRPYQYDTESYVPALKKQYAGLPEWSRRHYTPGKIDVDGRGKPIVSYERLRIDGASSPSLEDQLDILRWFAGHGRIPVPETRILRRDGRLETFLRAAIREAGEELARTQQAAKGQGRVGDATAFARRVRADFDSALEGVRDLGVIRRSAQIAWEELSKILAERFDEKDFAEKERSIVRSGKSLIAVDFFASLNAGLERAIIDLNAAGRRPAQAELAGLASLIRSIESVLRPYPGALVARAHMDNLGRNLSSDRAYMRAFHNAHPKAVLLMDWWVKRADQWMDRQKKGVQAALFLPAILLVLVFGLPVLLGVYAVKLTRKLFPRPSLPGVPEEHARALERTDFVHFIGLLGDPAAPPERRVMAAALLDRYYAADRNRREEDPVGRSTYLASSALARWLLEQAVEDARGPELAALVRTFLRINDLHPSFLQADVMSRMGSERNAFRRSSEYFRRNEPGRALLRMEHPFRDVNARWALALAEKLDRRNAWPASTEEKLDLLDLLDSTGEFSDVLDRRIVALATADKEGFVRWVLKDQERVKRWAGEAELAKLSTPMGEIPLPAAQPLRIVRNPALRTRLFGLLPGVKYEEQQARVPVLEWLRTRWSLFKAYQRAREFFSKEFLMGLDHEGSLEDKFIQVLEEVDRIGQKEADETRARWDAGKFTKEDLRTIASLLGRTNPETLEPDGFKPQDWKTLLEHEKESVLSTIKRLKSAEALAAIMALYQAYARTQEPLLGLILQNYPEPTRSRDELLEKLIKARKLTPGSLAFLESHKSYRMPNPLRITEKHLMDLAVIQLGKFDAAERVDLLLELAGVRPLSKEKERAFNRRILSGDRKKLAREKAALRSVFQLKSYMSLMHAKDRALLVRVALHAESPGRSSLREAPEEMTRLFEALVVEGRDLPKFMLKVLRAYWRVLTFEERSRMIADLAALENVGPKLKGPEILKVALKNAGVTGAKIAQALASHKGLLSEEYARVLEEFKDKAQDLEKMRVLGLVSERLAAIAPVPASDAAGKLTVKRLIAAVREALPNAGEAQRVRFLKEARLLLAGPSSRVRRIESLGSELGAGSIKLVYKVTLDDGRVWVVKVRAPGAAYKTTREFELLEKLIAEMEAEEDFDAPAARQILSEVKSLVRAELDFRDEAVKEDGVRERARSRPWYARFIAGPAPFVPKPHAVYVGEDLMVEEFVPSVRFADLPASSLIGPSRASLSRLAVREGTLSMVYDGWLEPDPHTGNRNARRNGLLDRLFTRLVVLDLGQGHALPIERLKPFMKAGIALEAGDAAAAARALLPIIRVPEKRTPEEVSAAIETGLSLGGAGVLERIVEGLVAAEKKGALVLPEYGSLQKAFILYMGYGRWLPKDFIAQSLERALMVRLLRDRPVPLWDLVKLGLKRLVFGRASVRREMEAIIDRLR